MKTYARVESGLVVEVILPMVIDGVYIPIEERYTPEYVQSMVDITDLSPMPDQGWTYDGEVFAVQVPYAPSPAERQAANETKKARLLAFASQAMSPLLVILQLGDATAEEIVAAKAWQTYYRALKAVDVTAIDPAWPLLPN